MAIFGNIFLFLASIVTFVLISTVYGKTPPTGGDAAAGYPMGVILFNIGFLVLMVLSAITISWKGGFDWISTQQSTRNLLVAMGILLPVITATLSALFRFEPGPVPLVLRFFSGFAPALIPIVMVLAGFVLQNKGLRASAPVEFYKWPLTLVLALGAIGVLSGIWVWMLEAGKNAERAQAQYTADQERYATGFQNEIDTCDVYQHMTRILVFTDANHDLPLRERAIAKVKTHPEWQQELVRQLENKGAAEVFNFLASNEVDDKSLFVQPVHNGALSIAEWIKRRTREASHDSHFYPDLFSYEIERVLRTVNKFEGLGHDYKPAIVAIREAMNEPSSYKKIKLNGIATLDKWLAKH
jgi:hypothetical protein